jgi:hypothetical protein
VAQRRAPRQAEAQAQVAVVDVTHVLLDERLRVYNGRRRRPPGPGPGRRRPPLGRRAGLSRHLRRDWELLLGLGLGLAGPLQELRAGRAQVRARDHPGWQRASADLRGRGRACGGWGVGGGGHQCRPGAGLRLQRRTCLWPLPAVLPSARAGMGEFHAAPTHLTAPPRRPRESARPGVCAARRSSPRTAVAALDAEKASQAELTHAQRRRLAQVTVPSYLLRRPSSCGRRVALTLAPAGGCPAAARSSWAPAPFRAAITPRPSCTIRSWLPGACVREGRRRSTTSRTAAVPAATVIALERPTAVGGAAGRLAAWCNAQPRRPAARRQAQLDALALRTSGRTAQRSRLQAADTGATPLAASRYLLAWWRLRQCMHSGGHASNTHGAGCQERAGWRAKGSAAEFVRTGSAAVREVPPSAAGVEKHKRPQTRNVYRTIQIIQRTTDLDT